MRAATVFSLVVLIGTLTGWPGGVASAQELGLAAQRPRFFYASSAHAVPVEIDASRSTMLRRIVSLKVERPTVKRLLDALEGQTGLKFIYGTELPSDRRVALQADSITVAAALTVILLDTGFDVVLSPGRQVVFREAGARAPGQQGTIVGRVADANNGEVIVGAEVFLEGTRWRASTGVDGRYRIAGVEAGSYTLAVRRIGYRRQSRPVAVADREEVTVDVALEAQPTQLNEIVTTATGEQRRVELGHVVGRINADSLVKEAPVSSLSELLNGRVPGLQVFQSQGIVGGEVHLQVRTPNSFLLNTEPIVVVDGVRYTSNIAQRTVAFGVEPTSPLNDLNPNDIESIEVVKGPSAATLYGTDAANGVIVITTKRGRPGPARWNAFAKGTTTDIPTPQYPDLYWGWHSGGFIDPARFSCGLTTMALGICAQDSVTALPNPLNDPDLQMFGRSPRYEYGANVSGGRQDLRYYFSGDFERAIGALRMPPAIAERLKAQRGIAELPDEQVEPNAFTKATLKANMTVGLGEQAELHVNTGYLHSATRTGTGRYAYSGGALSGTPTQPYGIFGLDPAEAFSQTSTENTDRFFGSANGQWRPASWLLTRATVGLDLTARNRYSLVRRGEAPSGFGISNGAVHDDRVRQLATTVELGATATARRGRLSSRTAVGVQYVRQLDDALSSSGEDLPPGGTSVGEAAFTSSRQSYHETVTLGSYLEQMFGLNDRLFLTGALRVDGASAFGRNYDAVVYPKASLSWLLSEEPLMPRVPGLEELRLRYAFGAAGQQALSEWTRPTFDYLNGPLDGTRVNSVGVTGLGNPNLRPERVREHEFGFDAAALGSRVQLGLTWYRRRTTDQIVTITLPPGLGSMFTNLGLTTARGFEAQLTARLIETPALSWDIVAQHTAHSTKLLDLGDAVAQYSNAGGWVEGYPLGARFMGQVVGLEDVNGDGVLLQSEVQVSDTAVYVGESTPTRSQTLSTVVGLFQQRVRLSALVERRAGFTQVNGIKRAHCTSVRCRAVVDPSTSLADQAEAVALNKAPPGQFGASFTYVEPGDFTRLREVTAAFDLPASLTRPLGVRSATLSLSARNLALWTDFGGGLDPESATLSGVAGGVADGIPQSRSWSLRLDLGL